MPRVTGQEKTEELCKAHRPDTVLMDIFIPEMNGLDTTARLASVSPESRVIILSMSSHEEYV